MGRVMGQFMKMDPAQLQSMQGNNPGERHQGFDDRSASLDHQSAC